MNEEPGSAGRDSGAPATRGRPGDLRSSRGPTDPLRVRVLGRRAVHDVSIDYYGV